jgi:PAS domain S-box-containing protein
MPTRANADTVPPSHKPTLLLVDDNHGNLIALQSVLPEREYELILAHSGAEALALAKTHDIALVLLDVQMPEMDGFETARRLKEIAGCRDIPIVFVTAIYKEDPFVKRGYAAGAVDYFSKPFDPEILRLKVRLYSALHQKTQLLREREKRIRQTEELLDTGRRLSAVLETLPVGVLIADAEGRVCQVNQEVSRIWGGAQPAEADAYGEFLGWWGDDGQLIKATDGPMARALASGTPSRNQLTHIKCLDGTSKIVLNSASPLHDLNKEIVGVVVVIQDITRHKQIEQDVQQRIESLVSAGLELEQTTRPTN